MQRVVKGLGRYYSKGQAYPSDTHANPRGAGDRRPLENDIGERS